METKIYPIISVVTRPSLVLVEALTKSIASQLPNLFRDLFDSPPMLSHQSSRQVRGHLDAVSTKELLHEERRSPPPPHKAVVTAPHQDLPARLQEADTLRYNLWFTQEPAHKIATPCSSTLSRANSTTNTLKACAKHNDVINDLLGGFENFFRVWVTPHKLQQAQMVRGEALYRIEASS
jgi:hypothetical protein